jgi:tetratricopeptide (TPR) repeat protein
LRLDPNYTLILNWLVSQLPPDEAIGFLETRLDDQPIRVEWHRAYQSQMERARPDVDLRPRYRKLLADTKGHADALYLLGRADPDLDEAEKLYRQAASANPPSGFAMYGLGYRALSEARFADARAQFEKALALLAEKYQIRLKLYQAMLANGDYDALLAALQKDAQTPGGKLDAIRQMMCVHAVRGNKAEARKALADAVQSSSPSIREAVQKSLKSMLCCYEQDVDGYLKEVGDSPAFEVAFLRGQLKQAASLVNADITIATAHHGLIYLAATRSGDKDLANVQWEALLASLKKAGREEQVFGDVLAGRVPPVMRLLQRLPVEPTSKRVLLAVLAQRYPDQAEEMQTLAKRLNFQRDAVSLCLRKQMQP